jgi:hypothetical protein
MPSDSFQQTNSTNQGFSRRKFMQRAVGAMAAAGLSPLTTPQAEGGPAANGKRPNIMLIITDQERSPQYWPADWAETNLPNRKRLADHGLTFTRAFCNTAMCSPSRTTLFTGLYPAQHGVEHTPRAPTI